MASKPKVRVKLAPENMRHVPEAPPPLVEEASAAFGKVVKLADFRQATLPPAQGSGSVEGPVQPQFFSIGQAADSAPTGVVGVSGLKVSGGRVLEEYLPQLRGIQGIRLYKEMSDNDATIGAVMFAIEQLLRGVSWTIQPASDKKRAKKEAAWVQSLMVDMSHTWEDFVSEALTNLIYGFSVFETVYKYRQGPTGDPSTNSKFTDGRLGWRKFAPRSQDTIYQWLYTSTGSLQGYLQMPLMGGSFPVPMSKSLLFRTTSRKNNPEGRSILRNAYRSWYFLKAIQEIEAIAIERELAGLPVLHIPNSILTGTDPKSVAALAAYVKLARDIKLNNQGGVVLPSDHYANQDGNPSNVAMVRLELLSTNGRRQINTVAVKDGYSIEIARTVLADFITLGGQKGSYALSVNKTDMFTAALKAWLNGIAAVLNSYGLPRLWALNSLNRDDMPAFVPGTVADVNLDELSKYITALVAAQIPLNDPGTVSYLRNAASLPQSTVGGTLVPQASLDISGAGTDD